MDWMEEFFDEALANYENELQKTADTALMGRLTYQAFEGYWTHVALDPSSPPDLVEFAKQKNAMRKIVFSRTLSRVAWNNSILVRELVPEEIIKLKQEPGRNIVIHGSASIVRALMKHGLIDRYQLLVYPIVLGSGKRLFEESSQQVKLSLVSTERHPSGVVVLAYQPRKE